MNTTEKKFHRLTKENYAGLVALIQKLCAARRFMLLQRALHALHPTSLALLWDSFDEAEREIILGQLSSEYAAEFLTELGEDERTAIFRSKDTAWIFDRLEELETDDIANILRELSPRDTNFILRRFDKNYTGKIKEILKYAEGTAGALMTSDFLAVSRQATVKSIVSQFQKLAKQGARPGRKSAKSEAAAAPHQSKLDDMQFTFVVDRDNKFLGYIPLRKLILEKSSRKAQEIMQPAQVMVHPGEDQEAVAQIFKDYNLLSLPVVDSRGILLGQITVDDVVDVLEEEATEDILRLGGVTQDVPHAQSLARMARGRFPWLAINLGMQVLSAWIVTFFDETLTKVIILAPLMTVISGQGGNATMQSITVVVRSLALGQINRRNIVKLIAKEVSVSAMNGILCGSLTAGAVLAYTGRPILAGCIVAAMFCDMLFAGLVGATLPLGLKAARIDPALASGPIATTFTDICGFSVFLGIATLLLHRFGTL